MGAWWGAREEALAVRLRDEGYSINHIAERLGRTTGAVTAHLSVRGHNNDPRCRFCKKSLPRPGSRGGRQPRVCLACRFALDHEIYGHEERTCEECGVTFRTETRPEPRRSGVRADCCSAYCSRKLWLADTHADPERLRRFQERQGRSKAVRRARRIEERANRPCKVCGVALAPLQHSFCSTAHHDTWWVAERRRRLDVERASA